VRGLTQIHKQGNTKGESPLTRNSRGREFDLSPQAGRGEKGRQSVSIKTGHTVPKWRLRLGAWPIALGSGNRRAIFQGIRRQTDAKYRPLALVQKLHFPARILSELAANSPDHVGTGAGQLPPGGIAISKLDRAFGSPGITATSYAKKIERHNA